MQIHITPRHLRLTASIHQAVASHVESLEDHGTEIISAHVVLDHDEAEKPEDRYTVKLHLAVKGKDLHGEQSGADLYVAIEKWVAKLDRQLAKRKTNLRDKVVHRAQKASERKKRG